MKGLYIHIPFCVKKCLYCDFVSVTDAENLYDAYINRLLCEMEEYKGEAVDTVFIGGGTPSILKPRQIKKLIGGIHSNFKILCDAEFTTECNPGTLDSDKIKAFSDGGVNRISVGVQSFNDNELKGIGRIHDSKTAYNSVIQIYESGIKNINIDLMTALPYQTKESLSYTLQKAVELPITHISAYSLIIEENTPLYREYTNGNIILPNDDDDREMYHDTVAFLEKNGFMQYEISNFAKEGYECKHNIKYWDCDEYIGIGAAAHSYMGNMRFSNSCGVNEYIENNIREKNVLSESDMISEFMMLGLREKNGISKNEFYKRFSKNIDSIYEKELKKFIELKLIEETGGCYRLTERGIDISNSVMCEFILT